MVRVLLVLLLIGAPLSAFAHAGLLTTDPIDGARLDAAPAEVRLTFNEPVTPISLRLIDAMGQERALTPVAAGETVRAPLPPALPPGAYTVSYRVTSADAHPVAGAMVFGVGVAVTAHGAAPVMAADGAMVTAGMVLRALANGATLLLAGGMLAQLLLGPSARVGGRALLALLAVLGHGIGVWVQGGVLLGQGLVGLGSVEAWHLGLASTRGPSFAFVLLGLTLLLLAGPRRPVILAGVIAIFGAYLLTGHAASAPPDLLAKPLLAAHVAGAGFWIGALPILMQALSRPGAAALLVGFSRLALWLVPLVLLAGVGLALLQGLTPARVLSHPYGQLLALKLACVTALLGIAGVNRRWLTPALARGGSPAPLRRTIAAEAVLMAGLLLVTGILSQTPPPRAEHHHDHGAAPAGMSSLTPLGDRLALLTVTPAQPGDNRLVLQVTDLTGTPVPPLEVVAYLALPAAGIENLRRPLVRDGAAFTAPLALPMAGEWTITVEILVTDFERRTLTLPLAVRGS